MIRFDPAALWDGVHVYSCDGAFPGLAPVRQKAGFFDADEARTHSRARAAWLRAERHRLAALDRYTATRIGRLPDEAAPPNPEAKVVRANFGKDAPAPPNFAPKPVRRGTAA